jgi:Flp pilus assembly pilin Flp
MPARIWTAVLRRLRHDDSGQDLIEYALLIGLVALVAVSAVSEVGQTIVNVFWSVIAASIPATP